MKINIYFYLIYTFIVDDILEEPNVSEGEKVPIKETEHSEANKSNIEYSESYSKMNLANKLSNEAEALNIGPISNNVINSSNISQKFDKLKPINITKGI